MSLNDLDARLESSVGITYLAEELAGHIALGELDSVDKMRTLHAVQGIFSALNHEPSKRTLSESVDAFMVAIDQSDHGSREAVHAAQVQVAGLQERLALLETTLACAKVSLVDVDREIVRRGHLRARIRRIQEGLENERDGLVEEVVGARTTNAKRRQIETLEERIAALTDTIDGVVSALAQNSREVTLLERYRISVKLVAEGIPSDIIGKDFNIPEEQRASAS